MSSIFYVVTVPLLSLLPWQGSLVQNHPRSGMLLASVCENARQKAAQTALRKDMDIDPLETKS